MRGKSSAMGTWKGEHAFIKRLGDVMVSTLGSQPRCSGFEFQVGGFVFLNAVVPVHLTVKLVRQ